MHKHTSVKAWTHTHKHITTNKRNNNYNIKHTHLYHHHYHQRNNLQQYKYNHNTIAKQTCLFSQHTCCNTIHDSQFLSKDVNVFVHECKLGRSILHHVRSSHVVNGVRYLRYNSLALFLVGLKLLAFRQNRNSGESGKRLLWSVKHMKLYTRP